MIKKSIILFVLGMLVTSIAFSQGRFTKSVEEKKNEKRVEQIDDMDKMLNDLIEENEILEYRPLSFSKQNITWSSGEVYLKGNKTLKGLIKINTMYGGERSIKIDFKLNENEKSKKYRADKIIGFEKSGHEFYGKRTETEPSQYLELIEKGYINMYFLKYHYQTGSGGNGLRNSYYIEFGDGTEDFVTPIPYKQKNFIEVSKKYFNDYPQLLEKITSEKFTIDHIREIVQIYNMNLKKQ